MKRNWVFSVLGGSPADPLDQEAAKQVRSVVQRVIGEDETNPAHGDAAPRPVSGEDADEEAKEEAETEEQQKAVPAALPTK
jgi:hypothetical protein